MNTISWIFISVAVLVAVFFLIFVYKCYSSNKTKNSNLQTQTESETSNNVSKNGGEASIIEQDGGEASIIEQSKTKLTDPVPKKEIDKMATSLGIEGIEKIPDIEEDSFNSDEERQRLQKEMIDQEIESREKIVAEKRMEQYEDRQKDKTHHDVAESQIAPFMTKEMLESAVSPIDNK